jgi:hypothetical protein
VISTLPVKRLSPNDNGRLLVRLNIKYRPGIPRYGIVQLTNSKNAKSVKILILGHDDETAIFMPYDIREALGADKGGNLEFSIQKVRWFGKVSWFLMTRDPAVHIPAWLALTSVLLGFVGVAIALCS